MVWVSLTQLGLGIERFQSQLPHQPLHSFAVDVKALLGQPHRHPATAIEGRFEILLVEQTTDFQLLG